MLSVSNTAGTLRPIELRARTASFKWQVSPLLLYSLPWHRARTEPSRKVSCQSASCRATLFGGSREKCFAFRSRSVDGTEYVTHSSSSPILQPSYNVLAFAQRARRRSPRRCSGMRSGPGSIGLLFSSYFRDPLRAFRYLSGRLTILGDAPFGPRVAPEPGRRESASGFGVPALPNAGHGFERRKNGKTCVLGRGAESQLFNRLVGGRLLSRVQAFGQPGTGS